MTKLMRLPVIWALFSTLTLGCGGSSSGSDSEGTTPERDEFAHFTHVLSSSHGFDPHPLVVPGSAWNLYFDVTTPTVPATYSGVLRLGSHRLKVEGFQNAAFTGRDPLCNFSIPRASNTILFQTELLDGNLEPTDGSVGPRYYATMILQGGFTGSDFIHICFVTFDSPDDTTPSRSTASRSYTYE